MEDKKWYELYTQARTPDKERIADLVGRKRGDRTGAEYATAIGITPVMMSRIMKGNYARPLTLDVLLKLAEGDEDILKRLLMANGMIDPEAQARRQSRDVLRNRHVEQLDRERDMMSVISSELFSRGVAMRRAPVVRRMEEAQSQSTVSFFPREISAQFAVEIQEEDSYLWVYKMMPGIIEADDTDRDVDRWIDFWTRQQALLFLRDAWEPESFEGKKISFVFCDEILCKKFLERMANAKLQTSMTVILVNLQTAKVVDEWPLTSMPINSLFQRKVYEESSYYDEEEGYFHFYFNDGEDTE